MLNDWAQLGCTELWNHCRLNKYISIGIHPPTADITACGCGEICNILTADGECPYTTPGDVETDLNPNANPAPWFDPAVPESALFAGLLVTAIDGIDDAPITRTITNSLTGGAIIGREKIGARTIRVTGYLIAATCCAATYGLRWLTKALRGCGDVTCELCGGENFEMFDCCPEPEIALNGCQIPKPTPPPFDYCNFVANHLKCLRRTVLTSAPAITNRLGTGCGSCGAGCPIVGVEFTLVAADPYFYSEPQLVLAEKPLPNGEGDPDVGWCTAGQEIDFCDQVTWTTTPPCDATQICVCGAPGCMVSLVDCKCNQPPVDCNITDACPTDPFCVTPTPPGPPTLPGSCFCSPLIEASVCYPIAGTNLHIWDEIVPVITIDAGSKDIHDLTLKFFPNPLGLSCADIDAASPCGACAQIGVSFIAAGTTLVIDGGSRMATVECAGGMESRANAVFGADGGPLIWPTLPCPGNFCFCVSVNVLCDLAPAADAKISVELVGRNL